MEPSHKRLEHGPVVFVVLRRGEEVIRGSTVSERVDSRYLVPAHLPLRRVHFLPRLFVAPGNHLVLRTTSIHQVAYFIVHHRADVQPVFRRARPRQPARLALVVPPGHLVIQTAHDHGVIARPEVDDVPEHGDHPESLVWQLIRQEDPRFSPPRPVHRPEAGVGVGRRVRQILSSRPRRDASVYVRQRLVVVEVAGLVTPRQYPRPVDRPQSLVHEVRYGRPPRLVQVMKVDEVAYGVVIVLPPELHREERHGVGCGQVPPSRDRLRHRRGRRRRRPPRILVGRRPWSPRTSRLLPPRLLPPPPGADATTALLRRDARRRRRRRTRLLPLPPPPLPPSSPCPLPSSTQHLSNHVLSKLR